ncbi:hypothetical protein CL621_04510, partial [archaeon]|nr:hypothetical protein [archaeon]
MKNNKSTKILVILCIIYLIIRLSILFTSPNLLDYGEARMGVIAKEIMVGSKTPLFEYQFFFGTHQGGLL